MNKFGKWGKKHLGDHLGKTLPICLSNLLIFFIVGIWHGAEWRYIMYGMYNGVIIAFSNLAEPLYKKCLHACHIDPHKKWWQCVQVLRTFILVNIGWVFDCSAAGMGSAIRMIKRMFTELRFDQLNAQMFKCIGLTSVDYIILLAGRIVGFNEQKIMAAIRKAMSQEARMEDTIYIIARTVTERQSV